MPWRSAARFFASVPRRAPQRKQAIAPRLWPILRALAGGQQRAAGRWKAASSRGPVGKRLVGRGQQQAAVSWRPERCGQQSAATSRQVVGGRRRVLGGGEY